MTGKESFWFKPDWQPRPEALVEFELQPLNTWRLARMQASILRNGTPGFEDHRNCFIDNVIGWRGIDVECTRSNRRKLLAGVVSADLTLWIQQIAVELYKRAVHQQEI